MVEASYISKTDVEMTEEVQEPEPMKIDSVP